MFEIFLVIILFIIVINHSLRLQKLERSMQTGSVDQNKKTVSTGEVRAEQAPVQKTQTISTPNPVVSSVQRADIQKVSSEESSGKLLGRLGIGAVLVGVAFFLKYAFDNNWVGPTGRVMIGVLFGLAFIGLGQYLRHKYLKYSDLLIGGGAGILYLSFYAAHAFYGLMSPTVAGFMMFAVTALIFAMSIVNATMTLSVVGIVGAFVTPALVGSSSGYNILFYLVIINFGVLAISNFKKWPQLNALAFAGTMINFLSWLMLIYKDEYLAITLTFVIVTFITFIFATILRGLKVGEKAESTDYFVLGANALFVGYTLVALLDKDYHWILGFVFALIALVYMAVAYMINKADPTDKKINIFLPGLAVVFLSSAVPLQFDGAWVAVAWLVEAAVLYYIASLISNRGFQVMGLIVYILGGINMFIQLSDWYYAQVYIPIINKDFGIILLAVIVAYFISYMYKRYGSITVDIQKRGITAFIIVANVLSLYGLSLEIDRYYSTQNIQLSNQAAKEISDCTKYQIGDNSNCYNRDNGYYAKQNSLKNTSNTLTSILWTLYAAILTALGFGRRIVGLRRMGLVLFVITAIKVLLDVWSLGQLYRIVSFIVFGLIALIASFAYAKYKDRLKEIV